MVNFCISPCPPVMRFLSPLSFLVPLLAVLSGCVIPSAFDTTSIRRLLAHRRVVWVVCCGTMGGDDDGAYSTLECLFRATYCGCVPGLATFRVTDSWVLWLPTWEYASSRNEPTDTWVSLGLFSIFPISQCADCLCMLGSHKSSQ